MGKTTQLHLNQRDCHFVAVWPPPAALCLRWKPDAVAQIFSSTASAMKKTLSSSHSACTISGHSSGAFLPSAAIKKSYQWEGPARVQYQTLPLSQHPFLLSCESRERQPVRQGFAVHNSPFIVTFHPHPSRGAVREPTPEHSPGNKSLSMVWSQPLYQMSPWSVSKSSLWKTDLLWQLVHQWRCL